MGKYLAERRAATLVRLTERLDVLVSEFNYDGSAVQKLLGSYEAFLRNTDAPEDVLVKKFMDPETTERFFREASEFGDLVWQLLQGVGKDTRMHRLLTI